MLRSARARLRLFLTLCLATEAGLFAIGCGTSSGGGDTADGATTTTPDGGATEASTSCEAFDGGPALGEAGQPDAGAPADPTAVGAIVFRSCSIESCHGSQIAPQGGLWLPKDDAGVEAGTWRSNMVGKSSNELPTMQLIAPGDPTHSWVIQKLEDGQCAFKSQCGPACGASMPYSSTGGAMLSSDERDLWVRWVAQGAKAP
jgi:hypothetical protein